ncbi:MAG: energy transducer TonB [Pseudomonadota bacterium]|nr:energy transducer TonB [Pseudomonadota bacterium]
MDTFFPRIVVGALAFPLLLLAGCEQSVPPRIERTQVMAVDTPAPAYPPELACADIGGQPVVRLTVGTDGQPTDVILVETSGQPALDAAALEAVKTWRFEPATRAGVAATSKINVPVTFTPPVEKPDRCRVIEDQQRRGG